MGTLAAAELAGELAIAAAGTAASIAARNAAAESQEQIFRAQQLQFRLSETDRANKRITKLRQVFGSQLAEAVARGVSPASPTFKAIQQQSFNNFEQDNKADALTLSFKENALSSQIDATQSAARAGEFASIANFAFSSFNQLNLNNPNNTNVPNPANFQGQNALPPPFS